MAVNSQNTILTATDVGAPSTSVTACPIGATVHSFFLSIFILGDSGSASGLVDWYLIKLPAGTTSFPNPGATGLNDQVRFIFHEEKGLFATQDGTPMVFKGVVKIPPRFRRVGRGDSWAIIIRTADSSAEFCVKAIYKYYQ